MPPHQGVTKSTFSLWIKNIMTKSGISTDVFRPHSCRVTSTSSAVQRGLQMGTILRAAGWSSAKTIRQYYKKHIQDGPYNNLMLNGVLRCF